MYAAFAFIRFKNYQESLAEISKTLKVLPFYNIVTKNPKTFNKSEKM